MINVHITKELEPFANDIRELCMAFFTLQKINYITGAGEHCEPASITIKNFYHGNFIGDRHQLKGEIKRQLYDYLSSLTHKKLLWGTLTGIRPVNIVTNILEDKEKFQDEKAKFYDTLNDKNKYAYVTSSLHKDKKISDVLGFSSITEIDNPIYKENESIKKYLKDEYYISDEKAYEIIKIARKEIEILGRKEVCDYKNSYSIYIGVPFCRSTCLYCSFTSYNIEKFGKYVDRYLEVLEKEFESRVKKINEELQNASESKDKLNPMTIYIGGGTPTSLDENHFEKLLKIIDKYVDTKNCIEYTVEAGRPDTITKEKLLIMKKYGVNRISINPQSFNQKTLDLIGRKHTVNDVVEKFKLARSVGFDNINMDIILGLPNEHLFDVLKTLNGIRKLKPDSFTVHSLALKRAARLNYELEEWTKNYYLAGIGNKNITEGKREIDKMFRWSEKLAEHLNLKPYYLYRQKNIAGNLENVGYAKEGKECIYNIMMMSERHTVYGFGTATTKKVIYRDDEKIIESEEGYKSVIDYCERVG